MPNLMVYVGRDEYRKLDQIALKRKKPLNAIVREAIQQYLSKVEVNNGNDNICKHL